jgi:dihydroxyacetone kinase-like protein
MKKLINAVENVLSESLDGFGAAHADLVRVAHDPTWSPARTPRSAARSR